MDAMANHAGMTVAVAVLIQVLLCAIPSALFLYFSKNKNPLMLGVLLGVVHLTLIGLIAVVASKTDRLVWLGASLLDIPSVWAFHRLEHTFSMEAFFAVVGTAQYVVTGLLVGSLAWLVRWRMMAAIAVAVFTLLGSRADAAGPMTHSEMGRRAWDNYLVHEEEMLPGISALWATTALKQAFYSGCVFPDTMQGRINDEAQEYAHWYPYQHDYLEMLMSAAPPPWNEENLRRVVFFLGVVCHGAADVPWHFDQGPDKSIMTVSQEQEHVGHFLDQLGEIFSQALFDLGGINVPGHFYWPEDDILAAFQRGNINVTPDELHRGTIRQAWDWNRAALLAPIAYPVFQAKWPWTRAHFEDYYYGGMNHGAALTAVCLRYCYARLNGWRLYQNVSVGNTLYSKEGVHTPIQDKTIRIMSGQEVDVLEPMLKVGKSDNNEWQADIHVDTADIAPNTPLHRAELWIHSPDPTANNAPALAAFALAQADPTAFPGRAQHDGWIAFDVTPLVQAWVEQPQQNSGIRIKAMENTEPLQFHRSDAMKAQPDGYGGNLIAYRPILVVR